MKEKWTCDSEFSFSDEKFAKIYRFFVIECPVENVSIRGISFAERKVNLSALNKKIKIISPNLKECWFPIEEKEDTEVSDIIKSNGIFLHNKDTKEIVVFRYEKRKETEAFFYCIRCALAHGGFCIHNINEIKYYCFENIKEAIVRARIILKEETLLEIINYCESKS